MKVIVTGSFDPITLGHMQIISYASQKYEKVYVVALVNEEKEYMFSMDEKKQLIEIATSHFENVVADAYVGLTADYMHNNGIDHIIRGVRNESDMEYEKILAKKMKEFDEGFVTEIVVCDDKYCKISSTEVRNRIMNGEEISNLVPSSTVSVIRSIIEKKR